MPILGLADNARRPVHLDDASDARSSAWPWRLCWRPADRGVRPGTPFSPLL